MARFLQYLPLRPSAAPLPPSGRVVLLGPLGNAGLTGTALGHQATAFINASKAANLGPTEIILLLLLALLLFGARRLPEIGRSLGQGMREFKDSVSGNSPSKSETHTELMSATPPSDASELQESVRTCVRAPADVVDRSTRIPAARTSPASSRRWARRLTEQHSATAERTWRKTARKGNRRESGSRPRRSRRPRGEPGSRFFVLGARR